MKPKILFIPGNGGGRTDQEWFPYVKRELEALGCEVISPGEYPDSIIARASIWLPYIESLGVDENTILLGWSSGALAAMRYAENHKILGSILIAPCHTDLGLERERESGYYDIPWGWNAIKQNQKFIVQFSSMDDPWIPIEEGRYIHEQLGSEYYEMSNVGHFYPKMEFPELVEALRKHIEKV